MKLSYPFQIVQSFLGNTGAQVPSKLLGVLATNELTKSIIVQNQSLEQDDNQYQLTVESEKQYKELLRMLYSDKNDKPLFICNYTTLKGHYVEFANDTVLMKLSIDVLNHQKRDNIVLM